MFNSCPRHNCGHSISFARGCIVQRLRAIELWVVFVYYFACLTTKYWWLISCALLSLWYFILHLYLCVLHLWTYYMRTLPTFTWHFNRLPPLPPILFTTLWVTVKCTGSISPHCLADFAFYSKTSIFEKDKSICCLFMILYLVSAKKTKQLFYVVLGKYESSPIFRKWRQVTFLCQFTVDQFTFYKASSVDHSASLPWIEPIQNFSGPERRACRKKRSFITVLI